MEKALLALLRADSGLREKVGTRVYLGRRPQRNAALPAVVLQRIAGRRDLNLAGSNGLVETLVQADVYGGTYEAAKEAAKAVVAIVNTYSGTQSGIHFQRISVEAERDSSEEATGGNFPFRVSLDLSIWHDE